MKLSFILNAIREFFGGQPDAQVLSCDELWKLSSLPYNELPSELLRFVSGANTKWHIMSDCARTYYLGEGKLYSPFFPGIEFSISAGEFYLLSYQRLPLTIELRTIRDHGNELHCAIIYSTTTA